MKKMKYRERIPLVVLGFLLTAANSFPQESGSKPVSNPASTPGMVSSPAGPGSALSSALAAACSQNQAAFTRFLTVRNQESFSRMTAASRVALMKRFVLLDEPGKATVSPNPSGRPIVRCETPGATTEMQIGGADVAPSRNHVPERVAILDALGEVRLEHTCSIHARRPALGRCQIRQ